MAALKKSGEEDWKKKIPRLKKSSCGEKNTVLDSITATLEANNTNNNTNIPIINNNGDSAVSGKNYRKHEIIKLNIAVVPKDGGVTYR